MGIVINTPILFEEFKMAVSLAPVARQQYMDQNGNPIVGGKLFTYVAGTNTKKTTYTTSDESAANTNPIILDAAGRTPNGLWLTAGAGYKFVVAPSTDSDPPTSAIYTEDNIIANATSITAPSVQWSTTGYAPSYISANSFSVLGDTTSTFEVGRRLRALTATGYVYGTITASTYATGITTVVVRLDVGVLDSGLSSTDVSMLTNTNHAIPNVYAPIIYGKNLIINPAFSVNQRLVSGTVVLLAGKYGHDRWKAGASGCTYTFATVNGQTVITIAAGSLIQVVEDVNVPYGTNTLTLSWTGTSQGRIASGSYGVSPISASVTGGATTQVEFTSGTLSLVQLEKSTFPTSFEQRSYSIEFDMCRRYYEAVRGGAQNTYLGSGLTVGTGTVIANIILNYYPKRRLPVFADFSVVSISGLTPSNNSPANLNSLQGAGLTMATMKFQSFAFANNGEFAAIANNVVNTGGWFLDVEL